MTWLESSIHDRKRRAHCLQRGGLQLGRPWHATPNTLIVYGAETLGHNWSMLPTGNRSRTLPQTHTHTKASRLHCTYNAPGAIHITSNTIHRNRKRREHYLATKFEASFADSSTQRRARSSRGRARGLGGRSARLRGSPGPPPYIVIKNVWHLILSLRGVWHSIYCHEKCLTYDIYCRSRVFGSLYIVI